MTRTAKRPSLPSLPTIPMYRSNRRRSKRSRFRQRCRPGDAQPQLSRHLLGKRQVRHPADGACDVPEGGLCGDEPGAVIGVIDHVASPNSDTRARSRNTTASIPRWCARISNGLASSSSAAATSLPIRRTPMTCRCSTRKFAARPTVSCTNSGNRVEPCQGVACGSLRGKRLDYRGRAHRRPVAWRD